MPYHDTERTLVRGIPAVAATRVLVTRTTTHGLAGASTRTRALSDCIVTRADGSTYSLNAKRAERVKRNRRLEADNARADLLNRLDSLTRANRAAVTRHASTLSRIIAD